FSPTLPPPPRSTLFPYTTLFRSGPRTLSTPKWWSAREARSACPRRRVSGSPPISSESKEPQSEWRRLNSTATRTEPAPAPAAARSEEHTSELQSLAYLVCRLLLD